MKLPDDLRSGLLVLSREIHADPELAYHEERAAARIRALLERRGHTVEMGVGGLATAFRARVGPPGPSVALLAEYLAHANALVATEALGAAARRVATDAKVRERIVARITPVLA